MLKVKDLIENHSGDWNMHFIDNLFDHCDVQAIIRVPILDVSRDDIRIWAHTSGGMYQVRSAYKLILKKFTNYDMLRVNGDWRLIWDLDIPPRVKVFLWRLCRDCLPTKVKHHSGGLIALPFVRYVSLTWRLLSIRFFHALSMKGSGRDLS